MPTKDYISCVMILTFIYYIVEFVRFGIEAIKDKRKTSFYEAIFYLGFSGMFLVLIVLLGNSVISIRNFMREYYDRIFIYAMHISIFILFLHTMKPIVIGAWQRSKNIC